MKFQITNSEPIQFFNTDGELVGTILIDVDGNMIYSIMLLSGFPPSICNINSHFNNSVLTCVCELD